MKGALQRWPVLDQRMTVKNPDRTMADTTITETEKLELRYVQLGQVQLWDENPKKHQIDALVQSVRNHGFGDPPKYDELLGGLVYGNGRTQALERMRQAGEEPPRGIAVVDGGEWAVPVIFGVNAVSRAAAVAFAIDHNNLTLLGGNLDFTDLLAIWDEEGLRKVLADVPDAGELLASLDTEEVASLLDGPDFKPGDADDQSRLDRKKETTCPECGHVFTG